MLIPKCEGEYDCAAKFIERHQSEFGFKLDRNIMVDDVQVLLIMRRSKDNNINSFEEYNKLQAIRIADSPIETKRVYFENHG